MNTGFPADVDYTPWLYFLHPCVFDHMEIKQVFAGNLRYYREIKGLSQEALAHLAGLDRTYISSLERCRNAASIEAVGKLANALEIEPWRLLADIPDKAKGGLNTNNS